MSAQPKVTIARVESWLKNNELVYELTDEDSILTGFDNCSITIADQHSDFLTVASTWRGEFDPSTEATLAAYVDEHNHSMFGPRATCFTFEDGVLRLQADLCLFTTEGMSDKQLDAELGSAFATVLSFYSTVGEDFPALVTWTEED